MKTATKAQQEQIGEAIMEVLAVLPSVPEHEFQETYKQNKSGVNITGLVLGLFPVLISALQQYQLLMGKAKSSLNFRASVTTICKDFDRQQTYFRVFMEELLEDLDVDPAIFSGQNDVSWTNDSTTAALEEKLSDSYPAMISSLNAIHSCLLEAQKELSKVKG